MARPRAQTSLESSIESILSGAAAAIAAAVRQDLSHQLRSVLGSSSATGRRGATTRRAQQAGRPHRVPSHCIYPGCDNASKGPRFTFMCEDHKGLAKADKQKYLAQWKQQNGAKAGGGAKKRGGRRGRRGKKAAA